jgi:hypothetical protein
MPGVRADSFDDSDALVAKNHIRVALALLVW